MSRHFLIAASLVLALPAPAVAGWTTSGPIPGTKGPEILNNNGTQLLHVGRVPDNSSDQVIRRTLATGATSTVSLSDPSLGNVPGNAKSGGSIPGSIAASSNFKTVAFLSAATNLTSDPAGAPPEAFVRTPAPATRLISAPPGGISGNVRSVVLSGDGQLAAWDQGNQVHVTDLTTGVDTTIQATRATYLLGMSADGTKLLVGSNDPALGAPDEDEGTAYTVVNRITGELQVLATDTADGPASRWAAVLAAGGRHAVIPAGNDSIQKVNIVTGKHQLIATNVGPSPFPAISSGGAVVAWRNIGSISANYGMYVKRGANPNEQLATGYVGVPAISGNGNTAAWSSSPTFFTNGPISVSVFTP